MNITGGLTVNNGLNVNGRQYGVNKVLWSGVYYMNAEHTITLYEAVSAQPNGIVLVYTPYNATSSYSYDYNWHFTFIPKHHVSKTLNSSGSRGVVTILSRISDLNAVTRKYVYVNDTSITGNNNNILYGSNEFILRYVIGV